MIFSIQQDCQKTRPFGTGVFVKCDQRQKINIFEHVSNICLAKKKSLKCSPKCQTSFFREFQISNFVRGACPGPPQRGMSLCNMLCLLHVCKHNLACSSGVANVISLVSWLNKLGRFLHQNFFHVNQHLKIKNLYQAFPKDNWQHRQQILSRNQ